MKRETGGAVLQAVRAAFGGGPVLSEKRKMNIGEELMELKSMEAETQIITKILSLLNVWDWNVTEVMRELVRLYDCMAKQPNDGHDISYWTGEKMEHAFKTLARKSLKAQTGTRFKGGKKKSEKN